MWSCGFDDDTHSFFQQHSLSSPGQLLATSCSSAWTIPPTPPRTPPRTLPAALLGSVSEFLQIGTRCSGLSHFCPRSSDPTHLPPGTRREVRQGGGRGAGCQAGRGTSTFRKGKGGLPTGWEPTSRLAVPSLEAAVRWEAGGQPTEGALRGRESVSSDPAGTALCCSSPCACLVPASSPVQGGGTRCTVHGTHLRTADLQWARQALPFGRLSDPPKGRLAVAFPPE